MRLDSQIDRSVNFVEQQMEGFLESRYVRKKDDYFICYLSSQSGCNRGCRFCWLSATKQTKLEDASHIEYLEQASEVLKHYKQSDHPAKIIHYNFMARGEVLENKNILKDADSILYDLGKLAMAYDSNLSVKYNISTIIPRTFDKELTEVFKIIHPTIYYSLYSVNPDFRKKWIPNGLDVDSALQKLKNYQLYSKKKIKIHHCFIEGENDSIEDLERIIDAISKYKLDCEFNLVRYNPYSEEYGKESSIEVIQRNMDYISNMWPSFQNKTQVIERVGTDVYASCGTFVQ